MNGRLCSLKVKPNKSVEAVEGFSSSFDDGRDDLEKSWGGMIESALKWIKFTKKDWVVTNKKVRLEYPLEYRQGIIPHSLIRLKVKDIYRIDKELGKVACKKFIQLVEGDYFHKKENTLRHSMTANDYFEYCKIGYLASLDKNEVLDPNLSGRMIYKRYADGRHDGLLDIEPDSAQEFADWIDRMHPKRGSIGHPFEIKRGGNTTHIDLYVSRPRYFQNDDSFEVTLSGASIGRLKETILMFLAIKEAGLPISISNPEKIRKRLLAQDNIGIIEEFHSLHRGWQNFHDHEDVKDVMHLYELGRHKTHLLPIITWEPLPILKPN